MWLLLNRHGDWNVFSADCSLSLSNIPFLPIYSPAQRQPPLPRDNGRVALLKLITHGDEQDPLMVWLVVLGPVSEVTHTAGAGD